MKGHPKKQPLRTTTLRGQAPREPYSGLAPDPTEFRDTKKADMPRREHNRV